MRITFLLLFLMSFGSVSGQTSTATYRVTFASTWSATTHPNGFPGNPHFSGLVGATHDSTIQFWESGKTASQGIEDMAERGAKTALLAEVAAAGGSVGATLSGGGITLSPGEVTLTFDIDANRPLVSLLSMMAPSPDWFVGVRDLDLRAGASWNPRIVVDLHVYDAGTDSGPDYTSADADTVPRGVIAPLTMPPFHQETMVGTYTFELLSTTAVEDPFPARETLGAPWPNPAHDAFMISVAPNLRGTTSVSLYDLLGRVVDVKTVIEAGPVSFDISPLPSGIYFVRAGASDVRTVVIRR